MMSKTEYACVFIISLLTSFICGCSINCLYQSIRSRRRTISLDTITNESINLKEIKQDNIV